MRNQQRAVKSSVRPSCTDDTSPPGCRRGPTRQAPPSGARIPTEISKSTSLSDGASLCSPWMLKSTSPEAGEAKSASWTSKVTESADSTSPTNSAGSKSKFTSALPQILVPGPVCPGLVCPGPAKD